MTIAARVPSRDSCSSRIAPGNLDDTGVESTGIRAGCPDASWMTRTTLLPSTTTHTASSRDQLGRVRLRPSSACDALPPSGPSHNEDAISGAPGRNVTIDATFWPVRDIADAVWSGVCPNEPGTRGARG